VEFLGEVGYAGLTIEDVAARARVSKASLYLRWPGKVPLVANAGSALSRGDIWARSPSPFWR